MKKTDKGYKEKQQLVKTNTKKEDKTVCKRTDCEIVEVYYQGFESKECMTCNKIIEL